MNVQTMVRAHDPLTSVMAAEKALSFAGTHRERILQALQRFGPMTAKGIAECVGLTVVQVDRRLPELKSTGAARVCVDGQGQDVMRDGYRCWEAA